MAGGEDADDSWSDEAGDEVQSGGRCSRCSGSGRYSCRCGQAVEVDHEPEQAAIVARLNSACQSARR